MHHQPPPSTTACPALAEPVAVSPEARRRIVACLQRCARTAGVRVLDALRRAEKRITENFRVPPHGG